MYIEEVPQSHMGFSILASVYKKNEEPGKSGSTLLTLTVLIVNEPVNEGDT